MAERNFKAPEGQESNLEFIRAKQLNDEGFTGVIVEGTYVESIPNRFDETKLDFKIEKEDGSTVIVNSAGNLGYRMSGVDIGDFIQLSYNGMKEIASGKMKGRPAHDFTVLVAE